MNRRSFVLTALALTGCGGSGGSGGGGSPIPVTVAILSTPARDGDIRSTGTVYTNNGLFVGDLDGILAGMSTRSVVGFDLVGAGIPPGATIQTATLAVYQDGTGGTPYTDIGNVLVDHVDLGAGLDATDYGANTLLSGFGVLSTSAMFGARSLEVGARVQADVTAGRTFSDFRLRFATDSNGDAADDYALFVDFENSAAVGPEPVLTVTYVP